MQTMTLQKRLDETESRLKQRKYNVDEAEKERRSRDRSEIGRSIITLFVSSVLIVLIAIVVMAWADFTTWKEASEKLIALLSSVVLPVVTLVIGYYFGTEQQSGSG